MTTKAHAPLQHQEIGDTFDGIYYVEQAFVKQTQHGKDYLDATLRDKSGSRFVKHWGTIDGLEKGMWVFIAAIVEDYMGNPSIIAKNISIEEEPDDLSDYIPAYDDADKHAERFDEIRDELKKLEAATGDETAGMLVDEVYGNSTFFDKFVAAPGSTGSHYGRQGGLLACTVRVADSCIKVLDSYRLTDEDKVILLASALLFRVGAIDAFEFSDCVPVETKRGILLGMNNLTMTRVSAALKRVITGLKKSGKAAHQEVVIRLLHAISSYDGACVIPTTREALILSSIYRMDSDMVDAIEFIDQDVNENEEFTAFDPTMGRRYYTG
jgi:3'-5' exoribonuclease